MLIFFFLVQILRFPQWFAFCIWKQHLNFKQEMNEITLNRGNVYLFSVVFFFVPDLSRAEWKCVIILSRSHGSSKTETFIWTVFPADAMMISNDSSCYWATHAHSVGTVIFSSFNSLNLSLRAVCMCLLISIIVVVFCFRLYLISFWIHAYICIYKYWKRERKLKDFWVGFHRTFTVSIFYPSL